MHASATTDAPAATEADTIAVGVFDDEGIAHDLEGGAAGRAARRRRGAHELQAPRPAPRRRPALAARRPRRPRRASTPSARGSPRPPSTAARASSAPARCAGSCPTTSPTTWPPRWSRARSWPATASTATGRAAEDDPPRELDEVIVSAHHDVADAVHRGAVGADAQNFARELQDTPANDLTPTRAGRARAGDRGRRGRGPRPRVR